MVLIQELGGLTTQLLRNKVCLYTTVRCASDFKRLPWNHLWRPQKYSKKDHDKIAEKYHLHPKDYQPYEPDNYTGDYPKLPMIGAAAKDPYYPYDIPVYRKNYHETLHYHNEIMGQDRYDYGVKYRINPFLGSLIYVGTIVGLGILTYLLEPYKTYHARLERQMPQKGVVHYTFEPANS